MNMLVPKLSAYHYVLLTRLAAYLRSERYSRDGTEKVSMSRRFLIRLQNKGLTVRNVQPFHVTKYLNGLKPLRRSAHRTELSEGQRHCYRSALHMLLRLVHEKWPPTGEPGTERERFHGKLIKEYDAWMFDLRGLCVRTRSRRCANSLRFLQWLGDRGSEENLGAMAVADIDAYVQWRARSLQQRSSKKALAVHLRNFLRYLHSSGRIRDLACAVLGPKLYVHEGIPSALRPEEIEKVLRSAQQDRSPIGLRDYAILTLLSTYGLRAGEITALLLEDIDWTHDRLRIHHSKTGVHSELPLLRAPGEAILDYLREGRPKTTQREVFLRACAPYRALHGSSLHSVLEPRLHAAGVVPQGKRGPHAFRHAKAASLLRSAVPLKVIGDVLAHRSATSTMAYLKLDVEQLRGIALDIPGARP
jgi:integrase/recombinase XerD